MPHADLPDVRLHYRCDGPAGAPHIVFANSLGATLDMWEPQVEPFSRHFRVLRYDMRGHGDSSVPPGPYRLVDLAGDVLRMLDVLLVERAHFCGLSLGGTVGQWLGAHAADRVERLVLCNTAPYFGPPGFMQGRIETVQRDGMAAVADGVLERWFTPEFRAADPTTVARIHAQVRTTPIEGYLGCLAALRDMDERPHLARIMAPTLVIGGTFDPAPKPEAARALATAIAGAEFIELPAAHLSNLGATAQFNDRVLEFLLRSAPT
jgi:3-oxoadipate enol-lactonase